MSMYQKNKDPVARSTLEQHVLNDDFDEAIKNNHFAQSEENGEPHDPEEDKKPDEIKPDIKPKIEFERNYDHQGHDHPIVSQDASRVGFKVKGQRKEGPKCQEGDWVVLNYQMYSQTDGQLIEDTTAFEYPKPLVFQAGRYQVSKCLDIATQLMTTGEQAVVHCPNDLDIGGGIQNTFHNEYGSRWLDNSVDSKYVISLEECSMHPSIFDKKDEIESFQEGYPLYLLSESPNEEGQRMALTVEEADLYAPRTTGVHNVKLQPWSGREKPSLYQQWIWNEEHQSLENLGIKGSVLFEGFNRNMIVYKWKGLHNQRFKYNIGTERLQNTYSGRALDVKNDKIIAGQNIFTNEPDDTIGQKWKVKFQSENHGHELKH